MNRNLAVLAFFTCVIPFSAAVAGVTPYDIERANNEFMRACSNPRAQKIVDSDEAEACYAAMARKEALSKELNIDVQAHMNNMDPSQVKQDLQQYQQRLQQSQQ